MIRRFINFVLSFFRKKPDPMPRIRQAIRFRNGARTCSPTALNPHFSPDSDYLTLSPTSKEADQ